jgi:hypothetical protein
MALFGNHSESDFIHPNPPPGPMLVGGEHVLPTKGDVENSFCVGP